MPGGPQTRKCQVDGLPAGPAGIHHLALLILPPGHLAQVGQLASKWTDVLLAKNILLFFKQLHLAFFFNRIMFLDIMCAFYRGFVHSTAD